MDLLLLSLQTTSHMTAHHSCLRWSQCPADAASIISLSCVFCLIRLQECVRFHAKLVAHFVPVTATTTVYIAYHVISDERSCPYPWKSLFITAVHGCRRSCQYTPSWTNHHSCHYLLGHVLQDKRPIWEWHMFPKWVSYPNGKLLQSLMVAANHRNVMRCASPYKHLSRLTCFSAAAADYGHNTKFVLDRANGKLANLSEKLGILEEWQTSQIILVMNQFNTLIQQWCYKHILTYKPPDTHVIPHTHVWYMSDTLEASSCKTKAIHGCRLQH